MALIKMSEIALPEHYVREKVVGKNLADLMDIIVKHNDGLFQEQESREPSKLKDKKLKWPFDSSILVAKLKEPEPAKPLKDGEKAETKKKGKAKVWKKFEIIDGMHRFTLWRRLGQKEIEANVKVIDEPGERYLEQYRTNSNHGLRIDKDGRDNAVKVAHNVYKISLGALVKETGLSRASVTRICASKQRKEGPRKKAEKKTEAAKKAGSTFASPDAPALGMSVTGFIERLQLLLNEFPNIADELTKHLIEIAKDNESVKKLYSFEARLADLHQAFTMVLGK